METVPHITMFTQTPLLTKMKEFIICNYIYVYVTNDKKHIGVVPNLLINSQAYRLQCFINQAKIGFDLKMKSSFISVCWINCSLRHPFLLMLISHEQRALIKCTVCAIINIGCCKGTGEVFTHLSPSNLDKVHFT